MHESTEQQLKTYICPVCHGEVPARDVHTALKWQDTDCAERALPAVAAMCPHGRHLMDGGIEKAAAIGRRMDEERLAND